MTRSSKIEADYRFEACSEMPCIPALLRIADSERRKVVDIRCKDAPLWASSRRRLTSSRDHKLALLCLPRNAGRKNLSAGIVTLTSMKNYRTTLRRRSCQS